MKTSTLLAWSLGLNLALAAVLFFAAETGSGVIPKVMAETSTNAISDFHNEVHPDVLPGQSSFNWRIIDSEDGHQLVANLRAANCAESTVADIICAKVEAHYAGQSRSLCSPPVPPPWENAEHRRAAETDGLAKLSAMGADQRALIKELLGYDRDDHLNRVWNEGLFASSFLGFLTATAQPQLMALYDRYSTGAKIIKVRANDILIDEDHANLSRLYDGLVAELSGMLAPDEMEELELRVQAGIFLTANDIHWDGVAITGSELRQYIRLSRNCNDAFQNQFLGANPAKPDLVLKETEFARQVEALLGQSRFTAYQRAQDYDFREIHEFVEKRNIPSAAAVAVYNARVTAENQVEQIKQDNSLSPTEQADAVAVLKTATVEAVSPALGGGYNDYLNSQGQWLQNLSSHPIQP